MRTQRELYSEKAVVYDCELEKCPKCGQPLTDYSLKLKNSSLAAGHYLALPLMGGVSFANLEVNASGGFADYMPADLPAYGTLILQLQSVSAQ